MDIREEYRRGKAKTLYTTEQEDFLIVEFRDDTSAFDGEKTEKLSNKGRINNKINTFIMQYLEKNGVQTHFVEQLTETTTLIKNLDMIPLEAVVRNYASGSICRRLGIENGYELSPAIFEFFLKNDELHDPMVNESHAITFSWASSQEMIKMREMTLQVNSLLQDLFLKADMILVDFKLEFGRLEEEIVLGDEFSPDGCRIWDKATKESFDKDRFRKGLGDVVEGYQIVAERLGIK